MNLGVVIKIKKNKTIIVTETGEFKAVSTRDGMFLGQKILFGQQDVIEADKKFTGFMCPAVIASAVAVFVFVFAFAYFGLLNFDNTFAYVDVDVNPSIEFAVNRDGIVIGAEPLNEDGKKILEELTYKDTLLEDVILDLIDKSREYGFITSDDKKNIVLISAVLSSDEHNEKISFENKLVSNLMSNFESLDVDIEMRFVVASKEQRKKAQESKVSVGKYMIYEMARQEGEEVTLESIVSEPLENLLLGQDFGVIGADKVLPDETAAASVKPVSTPSVSYAAVTEEPLQATATPSDTPIKPTATPTKAPAEATPSDTPVKATATPTNVLVTATPTPTVKPTQAVESPTNTPVKPTATPVKTPMDEKGVKVRFYNNNTLSETGVIYARINVVNTGNTTLNLSDMKLRYYYTIDSDSPQRFNCDWSSIGAHNVTGSFGKINPPKEGADTYVEIGFVEGAGELQPGESVELNARFSKTDNTQYNKADDYSFNSYYYEYVDWDKITVYISGSLKWGREP
ncbi:MAG TPA: cellulose binding domain-containing protein [Acetivibrio sp.]|uniref:anti-sigma-I factor RsgI family protein n=1 Tax=Acetivibrio sp. TaxID=1872092 RepID=UPI002BB98F0B|nr:cellulose binding domain-containing protein [Acetivibrio sp.]HOM03167.1 cellulose binding domain-containing protein [Acetivibrio sp.]